MNNTNSFDPADTSRIIEMAWEDRTPFEAIASNYGLSEAQVIALMREQLKRSAFNNWRRRVNGRVTKHQAKRPAEILRGYCPSQYKQR
jgi:uncharacterized protein (TIGR03643 family)